VLKLVKAKYRDFDAALACEYLAKDHAVKVSKETLRQWMIAAGLRVKRRKAQEMRVWRQNRNCWASSIPTPICSAPTQPSSVARKSAVGPTPLSSAGWNARLRESRSQESEVRSQNGAR
jgi:hypothetical protein